MTHYLTMGGIGQIFCITILLPPKPIPPEEPGSEPLPLEKPDELDYECSEYMHEPEGEDPIPKI